MSGAGAGALMGKSAKEGEELLAKYFTLFPGISAAINTSKENLKKFGYVDGLMGRRRRLPDIYLKPYEVRLAKQQQSEFNPFINCSDRLTEDPRIKKWELAVDNAIQASQQWQMKKALEAGKKFEPSREMSNAKYEKLAKDALKDGIIIQANTGRIAQAERQCFNALIQGAAGTLTKKAMIDIFNDEQLKKWDAHLIITVHDEVLVECPAVYSDLVEKRLPEIMINAATELGITSPKMQCDPYNVTRWYVPEQSAAVLKEFNSAKAKNMSKEEALKAVIANHEELPEAAIIKTIETGEDLDF